MTLILMTIWLATFIIPLALTDDLDRSFPNLFFHIRPGSREDTHNRGYNYQVFGFVIFVPGIGEGNREVERSLVNTSLKSNHL